MKKPFVLSSVLLVLCAVLCGAGQEPAPKHLTAAQNLVKQLDFKDNSYVFGGNLIAWDAAALHADCSGFINGLLMHSYGYSKEDFKKWLGGNRPTASSYHAKTLAQVGFTHVKQVKDVRGGDILAVKYPAGKKATGHVMLAAGPAQKMAAVKPLIDGTEQWEIPVIDSAGSGHGPTDTRHAKGSTGKDHDGLGLGILRVYADAQGEVAGYSWSTLPGARFMAPKDGHLVIGRLKPNFKP